MDNKTIKRMSEVEHIAVSILRAHDVPHMTREWKDYETAKHYIELQPWGDPTEYVQALRVAAEWCGV